MKFSLILPFRERIWLFERMVESLFINTRNIKEIELLIAIDEDDKKVIEFLEKNIIPIKHRVLICKRSTHFTKDYINPLARIAEGRWVITINDDTEFNDPDWDYIIDKDMESVADTIGDDVLLGLTRDEIDRRNEHPLFPHFSSFPVIGRELVTALGFLQDERCKVWGPDHIIANIFRSLDISRIVSLTHITIGHYSSHTGRRLENENYEYFERIDKESKVQISKLDHSETIKKLKRYIQKRRDDNI